jgi:aryl-alcohol dehydrogenase-like predicted oxidoreductase
MLDPVQQQGGNAMQDVRLGTTDLQVSAVGLGTWSYGSDWGEVDVTAATKTIHRALELGINLFDTAQAYGFGQAEQVLADALWGRVRREDVVVATKGGLRMDGNRLVRDASPGWLRQGVEQSLRFLRTDYVDLYQIHWPDTHTPLEETAAGLAALVAEGKVRHVGVSNYDADQLAGLERFIKVETLQPPYHLFRRQIEGEVLPYCAAHDIGVLVYGPLAHGLLGGTMSMETTFPSGDWRGQSPDFSGENLAANLAVVDELKAFADEHGISLVELAVAWTLAHPAVDVALVGARRPDHLVELVAAADVKLDDDDLDAIGRIVRPAVPVRGPAPEGM